MRTVWMWVLIAGTCSAAMAGQVGVLEPVAGDFLAPDMRAGAPISSQTFLVAQGKPGIVNPKAVVATFTPPGRKLLVAVDSDDAQASAPSILRFDFSGQGDFANAPTVPLKSDRSGRYSSDRATIMADLDGRPTPVTVTVPVYVRSGAQRYMYIQLSMAAAGDCRFGEQVRPVAVVDRDGNLSLGDAVRPLDQSGPSRQARGDMLLVGEPGGTLAGAAWHYLGSPLKVGNRWYMVKVDPASLQVTAEPVDLATGSIQIAHDHWNATLVGKQYVLRLSGSKEPVEAPVGRYYLSVYQETASADGGQQATLNVQRTRPPRDAGLFEVAAGQTVQVATGSPVGWAAKPTVRGRDVTFDLETVDNSGATNTEVAVQLTDASGRPQVPKLVVKDAAGQVVHQGTFEFG